ncbi:MAG TPA: hypothetical protein VHD36_22235 [Pirellulales bacterium]|nr:hypothetical protein [Pirellulales bacterium]
MRELHQAERDYLETPFEWCDGARPYVKDSFDSRDPSGSLKGFCPRSSIPEQLPIAPPPAENPNRPLTRGEQIDKLRHEMVGFEITELPDGIVQARRIIKARSLLQRILAWFAPSRAD